MRQGNRNAITIIELLVVIVVIGILSAILLPTLQGARSTSRRIACISQMRQLSQAVAMFHDVNGKYPIFGFEETSWTCEIMPYLDDQGLKRRASQRVNHDSSPFVATAVPIFHCPAHPDLTAQSHSTLYKNFGTKGLTSYLGVAGMRYKERYSAAGDTGVLGAWVNNNAGVNSSMVRDGTANTLLIGERPPGPGRTGDWGWWAGRNDWDIIMYPSVLFADVPPSRISRYQKCVYPAIYRAGNIDNPCDQDHFWSLHPDGANWAMVDGSIRFIPYTVDPFVMDQMSTRDGGEIVNMEW